MKIVFFSTYFDPYISGMITSPSSILKCLAQKGYDITVLTFAHKKNLPKKEKKDGLTIVRMPFLFKVSKGYISPQSFFYFIKTVLVSDRVILNIPNFEGGFLALVGFLLGKKIISIYNCEVYLGNGFISQCIVWFLNASIYLQLLLSKHILTYTKDYADNSSLLKKFTHKTHYVYPYIETPSLDKTYLQKLKKLKKMEIWIGFAGRIAREKGIEYLIEACNRLIKLYPSIRLIFAGPSSVAGEQIYKTQVLAKLKKSGVPYLFFEDLPDKQFGSLLQIINVLVLSSVNKTEAFGIVQVQAMLLNTPVIATHLPGIRVPTTLTHMGQLITPKDGNSIRDALIKIINSPNQFTNLLLLKKAKKIFDPDIVLKEYLRIIKS